MLIPNRRELEIRVELQRNGLNEFKIFSKGSKLRRDPTQVQEEVELHVYVGGLFSHHLNNVTNEIWKDRS